MSDVNVNPLGHYLKDRRARLDPAALGFSVGRRRTPGLRREEVALLANVSTTWYTWLEQGRGGAPSAEVLERLAHALALNAIERDHLFLLAQHRLPHIRQPQKQEISPRLQRILDALTFCPALVKNATWDIVGWNQAATVVLANYPQMKPRERNLLRLLFANPQKKNTVPHWPQIARFLVATLRSETTRHGINAQPLVDELSAVSDEFRQLWQQQDVESFGEGTKEIWHEQCGALTLEYATFTIDRQPDLGLMIYQPAGEQDLNKIKQLLANATHRPT
ncbi:transcriptional regulator [Erwinia sp. OLTSP20]|uniref:helix-turn-helix transcriptional regulator n=1 Tax=unclassified Erwinia TaxID=2622719 RepID=UPI000C192557|nr:MULTISPECIES: helix-turn-helix transcriptional regulator [unclassified Erwinia]PIJ49227.1 transcriptional regulator [Erwinia sp. OAMSP11]PIJ70509.1 transcriptional regulator [Erwinia sp. OLSSP12]PIJ78741.1 transcriptional regulator [Erwinia sp. OLCASP19]PIJ81236.1 transcriptional regulator [Erwinia sp. OLMTSP26]PIJ84485.1 transcriptional regulator [Erwinia sp. OLMDSP33]